MPLLFMPGAGVFRRVVGQKHFAGAAALLGVARTGNISITVMIMLVNCNLDMLFRESVVSNHSLVIIVVTVDP
jgi:hypothetical protein